MTFFSILIGFEIGLSIGTRIFNNPEVDETHKYLRKFIREKKSEVIKNPGM